ncbi:MAG: hypothetical protein NVS3B26_05660 [Mycobacteriales bacterium]
MSPYDVTPDGELVDVAAVAADDAGVEQLRRSLSPVDAVVWDDDEVELDPAFALLRVLQHDVARDLPAAAALLPAGVTALPARPRRFGRTATIAAVTAGVLSIGGVAAATSGPGSPLGGVRSALRSAVINVVDAITPGSPPSPTAAAHRTSAAEPSPEVTAPGDQVSEAARSASTATQVAAELDKAGRLMGEGRYGAAAAQLDVAARALPLILDAGTRDPLAARLASLRALVTGSHPGSTHSGSSGDGRARDPRHRTTHDPRGASSDGAGSTSGGSVRKGSSSGGSATTDSRGKGSDGRPAGAWRAGASTGSVEAWHPVSTPPSPQAGTRS